MELPDDVLAIVRAFSKPLMKFSDKYNKCIQEMKFNRQVFYLQKIVKKRLCDKDADQVIQAFVEYVDALLAYKNMSSILASIPNGDPDTWKERSNINARLSGYSETQYKKTIVMLDLLYIQEKEENMIRQYKYEKKFANFTRYNGM
jgi:hypothetical protein